LEELGFLLEATPVKVEETAARMIKEKRLNGSLDQSKGTVEFTQDNDTLVAWDKSIQALCISLNETLVNNIELRYFLQS
jgi:hypothetical protein